ncbi:MAG: glycosyltransferase [Candidatus Bathyarchaeota archaeon]|nr:glycosyltransferase [Candidatus Bathyarchaeota archaeon]
MLQHANFSIPKRKEGYTTDDNSRALIVCTRHYSLKGDTVSAHLANVYLAFLQYMQTSEGKFHNYLSYPRHFLDTDCSDDCLGRTLWSLGCTINSNLPNDLRIVSKELFDESLPQIWNTHSIRGYAFCILGLCHYHQTYPQDSGLKADIEKLADKITKKFSANSKEDWQWFEQTLTYDNAKLPHALIEAYLVVKKPEYLSEGLNSLDFLLKTQLINGSFVPIGNNGWYQHGGTRAVYDQQPLEASATVEATASAFYATKKPFYAKVAREVFDWFLGKNTLKVMMYNPVTGGCFDGINSEHVNMNQGAESAISYLLARLEIERLKQFTP